MKKTVFILILLMSLMVCSCTTTKEDIAESMKQSDFTAGFSYAGHSDKIADILADAVNDTVVSSSTHYPVHIVKSAKELNEYKSKYFDSNILATDWNELPSFNSATAGFDDKFFKSNVVYIIYIPTNSSSYRFTLKETTIKDDTLLFSLEDVSLSDDKDADMWGMFVTVTAPKKYSDAFDKADAILVS